MTRFLSYLTGRISKLERPAFLIQIFIRIFVRVFRIDLEDTTQKKFSSLYKLFTREVKTRNISSEIIHPIDGKLVSFGKVENGQTFLIKGKNYAVSELIKGDSLEDYFFYNYYLSPQDYHRVHHPVSGQYDSCYEIKGALFPVAPWFVKWVPSVFSKNYRTVSKVQSSYGDFFIVMVGALNVGSIEMSRKLFTYSDVQVKAGDHLGTFGLGSSVVIFSPVELNVELGKVRFASPIDLID